MLRHPANYKLGIYRVARFGPHDIDDILYIYLCIVGAPLVTGVVLLNNDYL